VEGAKFATAASFETSLVPMLLADDQRRYVGANQAVCLLLRLDREAVLQRTVDDVTPPEFRHQMTALWSDFLRDGVHSGTFELLMPDGPRMRVDYSATANVEPGRHLSILLMPPSDAYQPAPPPKDRTLTEREREVLTLVAMGESGATIGRDLGVSRRTVETHVRHCLAKLEAKNRAHAIALALQRGEIFMTLGDGRDGDLARIRLGGGGPELRRR
jgi:PAS domain S-box-containing protein